MYKLTTNKHQCWDPILAAVSVLNMYIIHGVNGLDTYTLCTVYKQNLVVVRHESTDYIHAIQHKLYKCYTADNVIHAYIAWVQVSSKIFRVTLLAHACNYQI